MSVARYVNLSFVAIGLVLYVVLGELFSTVIELFGASANKAILGSNFRLGHLIAMFVSVGIAFALRKSSKVYGFSMEVGQELSKVTWPTWQETKKATRVVIITTLILSFILGFIDWGWDLISGFIYSL